MRVRVESSRIIKPSYGGDPPPTTLQIPLSVFDNVAFDIRIAYIAVFRPPVPSNSTIEKALIKLISEYREWAGRLGEDAEGSPVIVLNDEGVRFVEASVEDTLDKVLSFQPSPELLSLHPDMNGVAELLQVQLTRFACGSLVLGFTAHHRIADGNASSLCLIAWSLATRGLTISPHSMHDRSTFFVPRRPPRLQFEHRGVEFIKRRAQKFANMNKSGNGKADPFKGNVVVHRALFTEEFLTMLEARASSGASKAYSRFDSLVAHLWRVVSKARGLHESETTYVRIAVNGRRRMRPPVPDEYFGNLVLWAFPRATVKELIERPLQHAAKLIHDAVAGVNDAYFKSFIDFASSGIVESEDLMTTADADELVACPNLEVDSLLGFPLHELDFGGGSLLTHLIPIEPMEGQIFLMPSLSGNRSIDAYVTLVKQTENSFKELCYSVDHPKMDPSRLCSKI